MSSCPVLLLVSRDWYSGSVRRPGELGQRAVAGRGKGRHLRWRHRFSWRHGAMSGQRVDEDAVFLEPVVEVRTGGESRRADAPNQIALPHASASSDGDGREM